MLLTCLKSDIHIAPGLLDTLGDLLPGDARGARAAVIADDITAGLFGCRVTRALGRAGVEAEIIAFDHGERNKRFSTLESLLERMSALSLTRSDAVFALGGGVVGDIAGLAAALYARGIALYQIPTTLLAAVDASVGGKNAVDLENAKNMAGTFYQPRAVYCDTDVMRALPEPLLREGRAEILKMGLLADRELFEMAAADRWTDATDGLIARSVSLKSGYVRRDETDQDARQYLNLGHTFGHAVEICSGYGMPHGMAVGTGLAMACRAAGCEDTETVCRALEKCGYALYPPFGADALFEAAARDKKRRGDTVTFVLPEKIGQCQMKKVSMEEARRLFFRACE